jgi:hypothetical protein
VRLFIELARTGHEYKPGHGVLKSRLEGRFQKYCRLLESK